jgi:hypothetical protein
VNVLIDFLVSEFSKYELNKDELKDYFTYQLENSGYVDENFNLLKADNEKSFRKIIFNTPEVTGKDAYKNKIKSNVEEQFYNKIIHSFTSIENFEKKIKEIIKFDDFFQVKNDQNLIDLKKNTFEVFKLLLNLKIKYLSLATYANFLKDSNLFGNWTIKPDMHIISTIPLLKYNGYSLSALTRDKEITAGKFQYDVLKDLKFKNVFLKYNNMQLDNKPNTLKLNIIFHSYDYCFNYNKINSNKISPKHLERMIFLMSTKSEKDINKFKYTNIGSKFHKKFFENTKPFFLKKNYLRHKKIIDRFSF